MSIIHATNVYPSGLPDPVYQPGERTEYAFIYTSPEWSAGTVGGITNVREFAERNARAATADGYAATVISRTVTYSEWEEAPNA